MDKGALRARASSAQAKTSGRSPEARATQPWSNRVWMRDQSTSAVTLTAPAMSAALGWAPLMPPSPELRYRRPARSSRSGMPR